MYSYSHDNKFGWMGNYQTPAQALAAGRAAYGGNTRIYVGEVREAMYSDMFIGARTLLSYMRERATDKMGDENTDAFDALADEEIDRLNAQLTVAIGEWEADLPQSQQFSGAYVGKIFAYAENEEVRRAHF